MTFWRGVLVGSCAVMAVGLLAGGWWFLGSLNAMACVLNGLAAWEARRR